MVKPSYAVLENLKSEKGIESNYRLWKETGVSQTILANWKNGRWSPSYPSLRRLADFFGVSVDIFYPDLEGGEA